MLVDEDGAASAANVILRSDAPASAAPHLRLLPRTPDCIDSEAVKATSAALTVCLRDGDLFAAERVLALLKAHLPDRRVLLADLLQPLLRSELLAMRESAENTARCIGTARDLLLTERTPSAEAASTGVLLVAPSQDPQILSLHMVALLLDQVGVPNVVMHTDDADRITERLALRRETAVCVASTPRWDFGTVVSWLRNRQIAVVVLDDLDAGNATCGCPAERMGLAGAAARVTDVADMLLYLRGPLSASEAAVLRLAADGFTNVRMAHELGLSVSAVKARLESAFTKLGAADRTHAVAMALRSHWIR